MRGKIITLIGVKGSGRRTLLTSLTHPDRGIRSLLRISSYTTRRMRSGESEGQPFKFVSSESFRNGIKTGRLFAEGALKEGEVAADIHSYEVAGGFRL